MRIFLVAAFLILSACAPSGATQSEPPRDESTVPGGSEASAGEAKVCTDRGGSWRRVCMMGKWSCVKNYADAGKVCRDEKDCEGQCRYQGYRDLAPGSPATGVCQRDSDPCGCFAEVRDGKLQHALCVD